MTAEQLVMLVLGLATLFSAVFSPIHCSKQSATIDRIVEKQCGQIESRKEYAKCVEELLK